MGPFELWPDSIFLLNDVLMTYSKSCLKFCNIKFMST